ncbi:Ig-like domain-containing protein [Paenarthrobacter nicotinovorans]|uniref:Ig-like domain-containing protein n=1 Tax=Paenarthrobacter nicotinovorans TaxID=29320 RepID=A0ABV0GLV2_PAENI
MKKFVSVAATLAVAAALGSAAPSVAAESDPQSAPIAASQGLASMVVAGPVDGAVTTPRPKFFGTGVPGETVKVWQDGVQHSVMATTVAKDGTWGRELWSNIQLDPGAHSFTVTRGDSAEPQRVNINVTALVVAGPVDGAVTTPRPKFFGTGVPGETVKVWQDGVQHSVMATTVAKDGTWGRELWSNIQLDPGAHSFTVTRGDSAEPQRVNINVSDEQTAAPIVVTSPTSGARVTTARPTFTGTGQPGATVSITNNAKNEIASAAVDASGNWEAVAKSNVADGDYNVNVAQSFNGQTTSASLAYGVTRVALRVNAPYSAETVATRTPHFAGTGQAGATVEVKDVNGDLLATTTIAQNGTWEAQSMRALSPGKHAVTVVQTAGADTDRHELEFTVEDLAGFEGVQILSPSGVAGQRLSYSGTGPVGAEFKIGMVINGSMRQGPTVVVGEDGRWEATAAADLPVNDWNTGVPSHVYLSSGNEMYDPGHSFWIAPALQVATPVSEEVTASRPMFEGVGQRGSLVHVFNEAGEIIAAVGTGEDGKWSVPSRVDLRPGTHTVTIKQMIFGQLWGYQVPAVERTFEVGSK